MFRVILGLVVLCSSVAFAQEESVVVQSPEAQVQGLSDEMEVEILVESDDGLIEPVYYRYGTPQYGFRDRGYYRRRFTPLCRVRPYLHSCRY